MKHIKGNILNVKNGYIFHICDCTSLIPSGFSETLYNTFPSSSPYILRKKKSENEPHVASFETRSKPGTVFILGEENGPDIVNMFSKYGYTDTDIKDTTSFRQNYFKDCLESMLDYFEFFTEKVNIHIPYKLGCDFSQSEWEVYAKFLLEFEEKMAQNNVDVELTVYH